MLVYDLPAGELPREAVELSGSVRRDYWQDTLIPLAWDEETDVTLYGVVENMPNLEMRASPAFDGKDTCGIVLRQGDRTEYFPLCWGDNALFLSNPWLLVDDLDGDDLDEAAVCTGHLGGI